MDLEAGWLARVRVRVASRGWYLGRTRTSRACEGPPPRIPIWALLNWTASRTLLFTPNMSTVTCTANRAVRTSRSLHSAGAYSDHNIPSSPIPLRRTMIRSLAYNHLINRWIRARWHRLLSASQPKQRRHHRAGRSIHPAVWCGPVRFHYRKPICPTACLAWSVPNREFAAYGNHARSCHATYGAVLVRKDGSSWRQCQWKGELLSSFVLHIRTVMHARYLLTESYPSTAHHSVSFTHLYLFRGLRTQNEPTDKKNFVGIGCIEISSRTK
jgi:hypothetical protein